MAVAFDAVGPSSGAGAGSTSATTLSWSHTSVASSGLAGVVVANLGATTTTQEAYTLAVTWGGVAMTSLGKVPSNNQASEGYIQLFGLVAPPTGTQTITVTASGVPSTLVGGSISYSGAGSFGTGVTAFGNSATPTVSVTGTSTGNMFAFGICTGTLIGAATGVVTKRWLNNYSTASGAGQGASGTAPGAVGATSLTWSITSDFWGAVGVEVVAGVAGGPLPGPVQINQAIDRAASY